MNAIKNILRRFRQWYIPDTNLNYKNKTMKKAILILLATALLSCSKEKQQQCNCGLITDDRVSDYSIVIRNSCSGNEKRFTLAPGDWVNAHVGSDYCITNSGRW